MSSQYDPPDSAILDQLITKLMNYKLSDTPSSLAVTEEEAIYLAGRIVRDMTDKSALVECEAPLIVCGDTHGQFKDLLRIFKAGGNPPKTRYLFLGDYVDRGQNSIETICLLFAFKLRHPDSLFLLRGNHETPLINRVYGFYDECKERYNSVRIWTRFQEAFGCLPVAGLVNNRIFCTHGGLSPDFHHFDQLRRLTLPLQVPDQGGLLTDLLWSDPMDNISGYVLSARGISYNFGEDAVYSFCLKHRIDLVARAHQVVEHGFKFFANKKLVTVFSASNYCGEFNNKAGMLIVSRLLQCKVKTFKIRRHAEPDDVDSTDS